MGKSGNTINDQMVAIVKVDYPGFDKPLLSKPRKPEVYGVMLVPGAERLVRKIWDGVLDFIKPRKSENRKLPCRTTTWFTESEMEALQRVIKPSGAGSKQEYVHDVVMRQVRIDTMRHEIAKDIETYRRNNQDVI